MVKEAQYEAVNLMLDLLKGDSFDKVDGEKVKPMPMLNRKYPKKIYLGYYRYIIKLPWQG